MCGGNQHVSHAVEKTSNPFKQSRFFLTKALCCEGNYHYENTKILIIKYYTSRGVVWLRNPSYNHFLSESLNHLSSLIILKMCVKLDAML